jgi:hypothetical protein
MGLLSGLFGIGAKGTGEGVNAVLGGIGSLAKDLRSAITGDLPPEKKAEIELKLTALEGKLAEGQNAVNAIEAKHTSVFVAGWRPFIGWVCGFGLAYHFIVHPILLWVAVGLDGSATWGIGIEPPVLSSDGLLSIVLGMLGLGGMRSWEKNKGVNKNH